MEQRVINFTKTISDCSTMTASGYVVSPAGKSRRGHINVRLMKIFSTTGGRGVRFPDIEKIISIKGNEVLS